MPHVLKQFFRSFWSFLITLIVLLIAVEVVWVGVPVPALARPGAPKTEGNILAERTPEPGAPPEKIGVGRPAIDFALPDLTNTTVRLSDFRGKPVLINFWATWCDPCRREMPAVEKKYRQYRNTQGLVVLGVDVRQDAGIDAVRQFLGEVNVTFPILIDVDGSAEEAYDVRALPTSFFVDRRGIVRGVNVGEMTEAFLDRALQQILQQQDWKTHEPASLRQSARDRQAE